MANSIGLDYGGGLTNIDHETGIRFGVIHHRELGQSWYDSSEPDYGSAHCPECGNEAIPAEELTEEEEEAFELNTPHACADYACRNCEHTFGSEDAFGEEPIAHTFKDGDYEAEQSGDDYDVFVIKSPFYSWAQFCSPCAPGAGYLLNELEPGTGAKTYCFGHDWFDGGKAPYRVFRVADDSEVFSTDGKE